MVGIDAHAQREVLAGVVMNILFEPESEEPLRFFLIELKVKETNFTFLQLDVSSGAFANTAATNNL